MQNQSTSAAPDGYAVDPRRVADAMLQRLRQQRSDGPAGLAALIPGHAPSPRAGGADGQGC